MAPSKIKLEDYEVCLLAESLQEYGEEGHYPIHINDQLQDGRYQILNKLGFGGNATVWVAQDHLYVLFLILLDNIY